MLNAPNIIILIDHAASSLSKLTLVILRDVYILILATLSRPTSLHIASCIVLQETEEQTKKQLYSSWKTCPSGAGREKHTAPGRCSADAEEWWPNDADMFPVWPARPFLLLSFAVLISNPCFLPPFFLLLYSFRYNLRLFFGLYLDL